VNSGLSTATHCQPWSTGVLTTKIPIHNTIWSQPQKGKQSADQASAK